MASVRALALSLALVISVPLAAAAQSTVPPGGVREHATATVVEVPVNVIGKDGRPVAGLTVADFELYDDGKKQVITGFDVVDLNRAAAPLPATSSASPAPTSEVPAAARRLWLLVFDLSYATPSGVLRARDGAHAFVARSMRPSDLAAVATLSVENGWNLLLNFTSDKRQLSVAVDTLGLTGATARAEDPLAFAFAPPNLGGLAGTGTDGGGLIDSGDEKNGPKVGKGLSIEDLKDLQNMQKMATDDMARGRVAKVVGTLAGIGHVLDAVRGRKHVLLFSEGFETRLIVGNAGDRAGASQPSVSSPSIGSTSNIQDTGNSAVHGEIWRIDSDARYGSTSTRSILARALEEFKRTDTVIDTVDISGLRAGGDLNNGPKPGTGTDSLFTMAAETDGEFVRNANHLGGEIERLVDRTGLVYLLAFQPGPFSRPGAFHAIRVKVKASGARVLARSGYREPRPFASLSPLERMLSSGDLLTGGAKENTLSARLLTAPFGGEERLVQVPVVLEIAGAPLLAGEKEPRCSVQIYAYATDAAGTLVDYVAQEMTLDVVRVQPTLEKGGIKFFGALFLPEGDYTIRSLVRSASSGRWAVNMTKVRVPPIPGGPAVVLPPFFADNSGRWIMVKAAPRSDARSRAAYPFVVEGESFIPAAAPVIGARSDGLPVHVTVMTYNFVPASKPEPLQVYPEIVGADGKPRPVDIQVVRRFDSERGGGRALTLAFQPEKLSPGRYALKVRVSDRASRRSSEASSDFEVR